MHKYLIFLCFTLTVLCEEPALNIMPDKLIFDTPKTEIDLKPIAVVTKPIALVTETKPIIQNHPCKMTCTRHLLNKSLQKYSYRCESVCEIKHKNSMMRKVSFISFACIDKKDDKHSCDKIIEKVKDETSLRHNAAGVTFKMHNKKDQNLQVQMLKQRMKARSQMMKSLRQMMQSSFGHFDNNLEKMMTKAKMAKF